MNYKPFTDSDLARMKAACLLSANDYGNKDAVQILALIARMEAAEEYFKALLQRPADRDYVIQCEVNWRKVAGN